MAKSREPWLGKAGHWDLRSIARRHCLTVYQAYSIVRLVGSEEVALAQAVANLHSRQMK